MTRAVDTAGGRNRPPMLLVLDLDHFVVAVGEAGRLGMGHHHLLLAEVQGERQRMIKMVLHWD